LCGNLYSPCERSFIDGKIIYYDPEVETDFEQLLTRVIASGEVTDEGVFMLRSNNPDVQIELSDKWMEAMKIEVTGHTLSRPKSRHGRVTKLTISDTPVMVNYADFVKQPAGKYYLSHPTDDPDVILENILTLKEKKLNYAISSDNEELLRGVQYTNVLSFDEVHGLLGHSYLDRIPGVNTISLYIGNTGTFFVIHCEDGFTFSFNIKLNRGIDPDRFMSL
jgi:hypothetical protein